MRVSRRLSLSDLPAAVLARNGLSAEAKRTKPSKYRNRKATIHGITFDSKREADYYLELKTSELAGWISDVRCQPQFELHGSGGKRIGRFTPDFSYVTTWGEIVVVDVKSKPTRTTAYMLRKRLFEAEFGPLTEVF